MGAELLPLALSALVGIGLVLLLVLLIMAARQALIVILIIISPLASFAIYFLAQKNGLRNGETYSSRC